MTLTDNEVTENVATGDGSGISTFNTAHTNGTGNQITSNGPSGDDGGGIDQGTDSSGTWVNNTIDWNSCVQNGGAAHASVSSMITAQGNSFRNNSTTGTGVGGGIYLRNSQLVSTGGNTIDSNSVLGDGGGVGAVHQADGTFGVAEVTLTNEDTVTFNSATALGGGVSFRDLATVLDADAMLGNTLFAGNSANGLACGSLTSGVYFENLNDFTVQSNTFQNHILGVGFTGLNLGSSVSPIRTLSSNQFLNNRIGVNLCNSYLHLSSNTFTANTIAHVRLIDVEESAINENIFNRGGSTILGIWVDRSDYGSSLQIDNNNFVGHNQAANSYAIVVSQPSIDFFGNFYFINAENNWWNSINGPHDPPGCLDGGCNNNPAGDRVWDGVDYTPWRVTP